MNKLLLTSLAFILFGCSATKSTKISSKILGDTRTVEVQFIDDNTFLLSETSTDKTYGYKHTNPVNVGGVKESSGPKNERRYLNALVGPNGEKVTYYRDGSCCNFKTPNGMFENMGVLDRYRVTWKGSTDTFDIYINMYDKGDLFIPLGFKAKTKL